MSFLHFNSNFKFNFNFNFNFDFIVVAAAVKFIINSQKISINFYFPFYSFHFLNFYYYLLNFNHTLSDLYSNFIAKSINFKKINSSVKKLEKALFNAKHSNSNFPFNLSNSNSPPIKNDLFSLPLFPLLQINPFFISISKNPINLSFYSLSTLPSLLRSKFLKLKYKKNIKNQNLKNQ
jgi:hypothetical protein